MELFVVIDTKGCGRLVGVFNCQQRAKRVANLSRLYYQVHAIQLNTVNPDVLDWTDNDIQAATLQKMLSGGM